MAPQHAPHHRVRRLITRMVVGRFVWLLAGLIAFILVLPDIPSTTTGRWVFLAMIAVLLIAAAIAARGGRRRLWTSIALNLLLFASAITYAFRSERVFIHIAFTSLLLLLVFTTLCILFYVLDAGVIGPDHIYGAVCAYLLIAMIFSSIYQFVEMYDNHAFSGIVLHDPHNRAFGQFLYFSLTTISTVGYGDIVPVSPRARSFCMLEELTGTFYVAILIARLAGLYPAPERQAEPEPR